MIKIDIASTEEFTFSQYTSVSPDPIKSPSRWSNHRAIHLAIDNKAGKEFTEIVFPIHDFDVRLIRTKQTSQVDEVKSLLQDNAVFLVKLFFSCVSPSGREWGIAILSDHPQFDEFRTFLQNLL